MRLIGGDSKIEALVQLMQKPEHQIPFLDYLRCLAIMGVFAFHALPAEFNPEQTGWNGWSQAITMTPVHLLVSPAWFGWWGVSLFFVISGFCIHLSHQRSPRKEWKVFFTRRFFRIYPPYLLLLLMLVYVYPWVHMKNPTPDKFFQLSTHILMIYNFFPTALRHLNGSFWSLAVELQLYLLYPLLLAGVRRWSWGAMLGMLAALEIVLRAISGVVSLPDAEPITYWFIGSPLCYWFCWAIGAALADDYLAGRPLRFQKCPPWIWFLLAIVTFFIKPLYMFGFLLAAGGSAAVIARHLANPPTLSFLPRFLREHLRLSGLYSYSIYLWHTPLIIIYSKILTRTPLAPYLSPSVTYACYLLAWIPVFIFCKGYYRFVEQPSIDLGKRVIQKLWPKTAN